MPPVPPGGDRPAASDPAGKNGGLMEKRMILAVVLSIAVLLLYQKFMVPPPEKAPPREAPSPAAGAPGDNAVPGTGPAAGPQAGAGAELPPWQKGLRPKREAEPRWIEVKTPRYAATVATAGGGIQSLQLSEYRERPGPGSKPLDIVGASSIRPLPLDAALEEGQPPFPPVPVFASDAPASVSVRPGEKETVTLLWETARGVRVVREYTFFGDRYDFEVRQQVGNGSSAPIRVRPGIELTQIFRGELAGDSYSFKGVVVGAAGKVDRYDLKKVGKEEVPKGVPARWVAADAKYFSLILLPDRDTPLSRAIRVGEEGVRLTLAESPVTLAPGETSRFSSRAFMGPKEYNLLERTGKGLEELVDYGWFAVLAKPMVWMLGASNRVTGNYGVDIILLTILIKVLFYPLQQKANASMRKMQELNPIIQKIREKHKDDRAKMNEEMMHLYKTYKINPMGGCLPLVLQIPVFIALYKGLLVAIELRHAPFLLWINDLSAPEHLWDIAVAGYTLPVRLLPLLMGISMFVQQRMSPPSGMEPAQQKVMMFLPLIFTFMFWGFPTGLTLYWLVNNILSIGQQILNNRQAEAAKAAREAG